MKKGNILIIDDESEIRRILSQLLEFENFTTFQAESLDKSFDILINEEIHVVILDVRLNQINSIKSIPIIKSKSPLTEIVMLTAYGTIADGIASIKLGAFDYLVKGDDDERIIPLVEKAYEKYLLLSRLNRLEEQSRKTFGFNNILGSSNTITDAISLAKKLSGSDTTLLITGETGTGKEIFAQAIHYQSHRNKHGFVAVNCASIPKDLLESELFGYKVGAFTGAVKNKKGLFEEANRGTLFLDEIGELAYELQAKLLRVLETCSFIKPGDSKETEVDVRIIAATNKNLNTAVSDGSFRKDLFYRISTFVIELPPLRNRKDDISLLSDFFINHFSTKLKKNITFIDTDFYTRINQYPFPGNIRELKNICERVVLLSEKGSISADYLPGEFFQKDKTSDNEKDDFSIAKAEKELIKKVLSITDNNKNKAAELLGIGLTTLYRKIELYDL
ncbi:MAG: sigma-54-dependent Fis family transcriptional regulator [Desulfobulbaceae bacterium]|nr:sigma-54-dependent Fis family transcriptional regulator [Desulfobulbaceae bacterium]